jgi:hypothetical protein
MTIGVGPGTIGVGPGVHFISQRMKTAAPHPSSATGALDSQILMVSTLLQTEGIPPLTSPL